MSDILAAIVTSLDGERAWALRSRRLLTGAEPPGTEPADGTLVIADDRVVDLVPTPPAGMTLIDVGERVAMPGVIDAHVHIDDPGRADWEGFAHATRAAAAGGVTTLVDMPLNSSPVTTTAAALAAKLHAAAGRLSVDCGFWGGVVPGNDGEQEALLDAGALGLKAFMVDSGLDDFPPVGEAELRPAMERLARRGRPLLAHAELPPSPATPPSRLDDYGDWLRSRPSAWEVAAIEKLVELAEATGCRTHIVHLATAAALPKIRAARGRGVPLTVETCPHYLSFAAEELSDADVRFKCAPPIRRRRHREALWGALAAGDVDLVASDHSPCPPELKEGGFATAWGGIASLQVLLPATWTEASSRGHQLAALAGWLCREPAELAGLGGRKGTLRPGADADLLVWDPEAKFVVEGAALYHRHPLTPYDRRSLYGVVQRVFLRGREVFGNDGPVDGRGRPLLATGGL